MHKHELTFMLLCINLCKCRWDE